MVQRSSLVRLCHRGGAGGGEDKLGKLCKARGCKLLDLLLDGLTREEEGLIGVCWPSGGVAEERDGRGNRELEAASSSC